MSHRNNVYREGLENLFDRYGLSPDAVHGLVATGHEGVPTSDEKLLRLASYLIPLAQEVVYREHEQSVSSYTEAFVSHIPQSFFERVDTEEEALPQGFIQQRFEEQQ